MYYQMNEEMKKYIEAHEGETVELLKALCAIPAPSHNEDERAAFVKAWLEGIGADGVYIDEAKNVVFPYFCEGRNDIICFEAHTDTVFPIETELKFTEDEENYYCPAVGDDTANLAVMLMIIKYVIENKLKPSRGVLFVANSCEEGLGNLKGTRQIFTDFSGRIERFVTFDGYFTSVTRKGVGSHRYRINVLTEGGHSWSKFGNTNAIVELARLITQLTDISLPDTAGTKTTFNVGTISGGTSVNTIAQNASALYEYRSDNKECLKYMEDSFNAVIEGFKAVTDAEIEVEKVGDRPCGEPEDKVTHQEMIDRAVEISKRYSGLDCVVCAGSTDCNIPFSLGIPAICPGLVVGGGTHTREEYIRKDSIKKGLCIAAEIILDYFI